MPQSMFGEFADAARHPLETAGVLLARVVKDDAGSLKLLARSMHWVAEEAYLVRSPVELRVASETYVKDLSHAEKDKEVAIWVHTHPNMGPPVPSNMDEKVDKQIADVFRVRTGSEYYGSLILSQALDGFSFTGKIQTPDRTEALTRIFVTGDRWKLQFSFESGNIAEDPLFDRNVRAFGPVIQKTISNLTIAVVGCGGTGSAVTEQLVRLGARRLILVDPDTVSESNLTRLYGSTADDIGRPKVDVVRDYLAKVAPTLKCQAIQGMITNRDVAMKLIAADVVFGCSDDNGGRIVLSRLSTYFMIPVIDCGVLLAGDAGGQLTDINGRITTMVPGAACLICRDRVDLIRARTETLTPNERVRLENEGYAP
ncbi:MAG TPA: ThiF family adenylyltransferase, partial [Chthoniobacterales bacterium]|nr:ThiF family adenylyltransferase [Chthoniobacterales bacterium]